MVKKRFKTIPTLFLSGFLFIQLSSAENQHPCRYAGSYRLRYTKLDRNNTANNILRVENLQGFRVADLNGADCARVEILTDKVFWIEWPGRRIRALELKTQFMESFTDGYQFSVSPNRQWMIVDKGTSLSAVNLNNKNEMEFFKDEMSADTEHQKDLTKGGAIFYGWASDNNSFWFAPARPDFAQRRWCVLKRNGEIIVTKFAPDPAQEIYLNTESGWIMRNDKTELVVIDVLGERVARIENVRNQMVRPRWTPEGNLMYQLDNKVVTVTKDELQRRLDGSGFRVSTIEKKTYAPVSW